MASHRKRFSKRRLDDLIRAFAVTHLVDAEYFWRLINQVRARSRLLAPASDGGAPADASVKRILRACSRMSRRWAVWRRPPETWAALDANPRVQFHSLVAHLFESYPAPQCMQSVWLMDAPPIDWFLHLAAGRSIRKLELPIRLSKRAAVSFMQSPHDLTPVAALRWAQLTTLGCDPPLARWLCCNTLLSKRTEDEPFWESVVRFLLKHQPISLQEVSQIIDFLDQQRFQPANKVWGPRAGTTPLQPEFSLHRRTLRSLRRHMAHWRDELNESHPTLQMLKRTGDWTRSDIGPFRQSTSNGLWTIEELLTDRELRVEGGIMKHCVASYIQRCARRSTSIWSMKQQQGERRRRLLTIEVSPKSKLILQAKGKCNASPSLEAKSILQSWADQEGLLFPARA